jgi:hypothetical protein
MSQTDKDGIIAASPMVPRTSCTLAHRIVLRDLDDQYVVHMQIFEDNGIGYFHQGNYVPKKDNPAEALATAWGHFDRRTRSALNMPEPAEKTLKAVADIAEEIIEALLPDDIHDRADQIRDDYMLESNIETFENLTGKSLWDRDAGEDADDEDEDEEDE